MWNFLKKNKIGIDLGTANTLVYVAGRGVVLNEPTVVAVSRTSKAIVAIGSEARDMIGKNPDSVVVHRPMNDGVIANYHVTYTMLRHFITKAVGHNSLMKPDVLISVPVGITSTERRAVIEAVIKAGANTAIIVKEPILAALGAGMSINEPKAVMVVDCGGGTTDVAVISLGGIIASTSVKCAGNKFDQALIDYIRHTYGVAIGDQTAEELKRTLAVAVPTYPDIVGQVKGRDIVTGLPRTLEITANELCKAIDYELKQIIKAIGTVLGNTPPELASDIIDNGIVMTGGTSQLSRLSLLIEQQTGVSAVVAEESLFCVVRGTGILLDHLSEYKRSILVKQ